ncbi:MAG: energy transducer TonB [Bacteroidia bacterium]|nr:energy transducer TonB [Bacteroidia bacterium]
MNIKNTSLGFRTFKSAIVLVIIAVVTVVFPFCGRNKTQEVLPTSIAPPPPPKPPTMEGSDTIWQIDEIPIIAGGDKLIVNYIAKNIRYPEDAKAKGIEGKVVVKFCISTRGDVSGYEIVKSVSPELDAEALRVLKTLTKFEPAWRDGKPVSGWYYVPISFTFK